MCCSANFIDVPVHARTPESELEERVTSVRAWLPFCTYPSGFSGVSKEDCIDGDSVLFAGLLCLSGEEIGCQHVKNSCDALGRCYRSPAQRAEGNSFSRDMAIGVLGYIAATGDRDLANRWLDYIRSHDNKLCDDASDNRCSITTSLWGLFGEVWKFSGLEMSGEMGLGTLIDDRTIRESAAAVPHGFPMHLVAAQIYLRQQLGTYTSDLARGAESLAAREGYNPFFNLLAYGPSQDFTMLMLGMIPNGWPVHRTQWSIERAHEEGAWVDSMGWEWIFLFKAMRQRQQNPSLIQIME